MPTLTVIAGANGAGKSTFAASAGILIGPEPVDPDALLGTAVQAGRAAIHRVDASLNGRLDLAIETTLAGRRPLATMRRAKSAGYAVELVYIGTERVEINIERVAERVGRGVIAFLKVTYDGDICAALQT